MPLVGDAADLLGEFTLTADRIHTRPHRIAPVLVFMCQPRCRAVTDDQLTQHDSARLISESELHITLTVEPMSVSTSLTANDGDTAWLNLAESGQRWLVDWEDTYIALGLRAGEHRHLSRCFQVTWDGYVVLL
jgi:hypothetical protein